MTSEDATGQKTSGNLCFIRGVSSVVDQVRKEMTETDILVSGSREENVEPTAEDIKFLSIYDPGKPIASYDTKTGKFNCLITPQATTQILNRFADKMEEKSRGLWGKTLS